MSSRWAREVMRGLCEKSKKVKRLKIQHKKKRKSIKKEVNFDDTLAEIPAKNENTGIPITGMPVLVDYLAFEAVLYRFLHHCNCSVLIYGFPAPVVISFDHFIFIVYHIPSAIKLISVFGLQFFRRCIIPQVSPRKSYLVFVPSAACPLKRFFCIVKYTTVKTQSIPVYEVYSNCTLHFLFLLAPIASIRPLYNATHL
nr:MAG TPA: hypothetical protein [Caudoviricetes sp.]